MRTLAASLIALFAALLAPAAHGQTFHVSPRGDDSWAGTAARPFATLERAQRSVRARTARMNRNIVVNLHAGTHFLASALRLSDAAGDSGENGHRVIYQAHRYRSGRQATAVVSGGRPITGWQLDDSARNVWRAEVGDLPTRQLYVDGRRATRAALGAGLPGRLVTSADGYVTTSAVPRSWENPRDIELVRAGPGGFAFAEARCGVAGIKRNRSSTTITMDQPCFDRARALYSIPLGKSDEARGLDPTELENSRSFLDKPGEFYLDRSRAGSHVLFYIPRRRERMRRAKVVAPVLEALIRGTGRPDAPLHDVTFRGLTFSHTTWLGPNAPSGFPHEFASVYQAGRPADDTHDQGGIYSPTNSMVPAGVVFDRSTGIRLKRNRFTAMGAGALLFARSDGNVARGNIFTDLSGTAVVVNAPRPPRGARGDLLPPTDPDDVSRGNRVSNNWIHDIGVEYRGTVGVYVLAGEGTVVDHNQINDVPHNGIVAIGDDPPELDPPQLVESMRGLRIVGNRVLRTMQVLDDGGGMYFAGEMGTSADDGAVVRGNVVAHGPDDRHAIGIYTDWLSTWIAVERNVVYDYAAAAGGCPIFFVRNLRFAGNFWDREAPRWFPEYTPSCDDPVENVTVVDNTLLPADAAKRACAADASCAQILRGAGLGASMTRRALTPRGSL